MFAAITLIILSILNTFAFMATGNVAYLISASIFTASAFICGEIHTHKSKK